MISDENLNNLKLEDVAFKYFEEYSSNKQSLTDDEFYKGLNAYLVQQTGSDEWTENLRNENYFGVHLKKGENHMDYSTFSEALQEVIILLKGKDDAGDLEIDFSL
jgi:hypothetical protein